MSVAEVRLQLPLQGSQGQGKLQDVWISAIHQGVAPFPMRLRESQTTERLKREMVSDHRRAWLRRSQESYALALALNSLNYAFHKENVV